MLLVSVLAGCDDQKEQLASTTESLVGYMTIEDNALYLDKVEIIRREDTERVEELKLEHNDMPSGYCIYNQEVEKITYELTDETTYTFTDLTGVFVKNEDDEKVYTTTKVEDFVKYLNETYSDSPPAQNVPFFIEVKDGKVISVTEKFEFTI